MVLRNIWGRAVTDAKKILCIEDNMSNGELFRRMLGSQGYEVEVSATGQRGIEFARNNHVDLILLDINLPGMTGFQVLEQLRASTETSEIPVVAVTANPVSASRDACLKAGFNGYVNKPLLRNELYDIVTAVFAKYAKPDEANGTTTT
jgi:CheY-like chemotaxis protein